MSDFASVIKKLIEESKKYDSCMSLYVCNDSNTVELILDTSVPTIAEWINGEGSDIALYRSLITNKVVGIRLPLLNNKLCISHEGPIKVNEGFLKSPE